MIKDSTIEFYYLLQNFIFFNNFDFFNVHSARSNINNLEKEHKFVYE